MDEMGCQMVELYRLRVRSIGYSLGLCDTYQHAIRMNCDKRAQSLKISRNIYWSGLVSRKNDRIYQSQYLLLG